MATDAQKSEVAITATTTAIRLGLVVEERTRFSRQVCG
jgi:hypothetical protein